MVSVVLNGLFWMPSILLPASTVVRGETISRPKPVAAAAPAIAAPARNLRRFRYRLLGVISDERMSCAFLICIRTPVLYTRIRHRRIRPPCLYLPSDGTFMPQKSFMRLVLQAGTQGWDGRWKNSGLILRATLGSA